MALLVQNEITNSSRDTMDSNLLAGSKAELGSYCGLVSNLFTRSDQGIHVPDWFSFSMSFIYMRISLLVYAS